MHQIIRNKIERNAEYHEAMGEYYTSQAKANGNGKGRAKVDDAELAALAETHAEAAKQLRDLVAGSRPDAIVAQRAKPVAIRGSGRVH